MTVAPGLLIQNLPYGQFQSSLQALGVGVRFGPFELLIRARVPGLPRLLYELYRDYPLLEQGGVYNCHFAIQRLPRWRRWRQPMVRVLVDGRPPHEDMPEAHALAVFEWGLNLVIAMRHQGFLMLHSAALERNGLALLLPASPGHGKTTLCAALVHRGWRYMSDEFGLIRPGTDQVLPVPRLMPLKNESIAVIREFAPDAFIGPSIPGTRKGTVAHVRPPRESVERAQEGAKVRWIVFPKWQAGARLSLESVRKGHAFMELATNAFNYEVLGYAAFETVRDLIEGASCHRLVYSDLGEAVAALTAMADGGGP